MTQVDPEIREKVLYRCKADLKFLCKGILGYRDWSENPKLHYDIAKLIRKPSKFKLFLIPRDHLKSSIITKGASIQRMLNNPNIRILLANNTWDNSRKFLRSIQQYLAPGNILPTYFGNFESDRWNQDEIVIKQRKMILDAPTIATTGLEKEQTSQHYDLIIADDLVARENVQTVEQRQKVKDYINSLMALLEPNAELWVVGTRWSEDDAYEDLLQEGIWDTMVRGCYDVGPQGEQVPLFPEKFTLEKLAFLRKKMGPTLFSCWYMNDPISEESVDFKKEQVRYYQAGTPHPSNLYLAIDPALSLGKDADFSAGVVGGMFQDRRIRIVDYFKKKVVPQGLVDEIFDMVKKWHLHRIGIETFMFQKTLKFEIERRQRETGVFFSIDEFSRKGVKGEHILSKEARIRSLQPLFEQGLVEIRHDMVDFVDELLSFPRGKHDDLIDATAYLIQKLIPSIGLYTEPGDGYMTMAWWVKNKLPSGQNPGIYERFMADLK